MFVYLQNALKHVHVTLLVGHPWPPQGFASRQTNLFMHPLLTLSKWWFVRALLYPRLTTQHRRYTEVPASVDWTI